MHKEGNNEDENRNKLNTEQKNNRENKKTSIEKVSARLTKKMNNY